MRSRRPIVAAGVLCALLLAPPAPAGTTRSCEDVVNPYPGTRYEDVNLTRIRATGVSCATARRVARRAHRKALGLPLPRDGVRRFRWNGWRVTGDLRPDIDRYVARKGDRRVSWRF